MDFTLNDFSFTNLKANKYWSWNNPHSHVWKGARAARQSWENTDVLMFASFLSMVIMWLGLQSGKQQSCVNSNHVVSLMCLKLSLRNQSAQGGSQANQHLCRWTAWIGWLAAYSVCHRRVEEKSNSTFLQTGQKRLYDFFRIPLHHQKYTPAHTNSSLSI